MNSASYFEQMKGRGVRVISRSDLRAVTPDADAKTRFVIVDAVGVCENDKTTTKPLDRNPSVPLQTLLQWVAQGIVDADVVSTLAARLSRLDKQLTPEEKQELRQLAGGVSMNKLASGLLDSIDPDVNAAKARERFNMPHEQEPSADQIGQIEMESMSKALKPFHEPKLREKIVAVRSAFEQLIDEGNIDELLHAGLSKEAKEKTLSILSDFRAFLEEHKNEIEAISILYSKPYSSGLKYNQVKALASEIRIDLHIEKPESVLWKLYAATEPEKVKGNGGNALVDLIAIVRHALNPAEPLVPVEMTVDKRYQEWLEEQAANGVTFTVEQRKWLDAIRDHIAKSLQIRQDDFGSVPFNQMGGLGRVYGLFKENLHPILQQLNERLAA
jgi:type I restriction enzyme R subunit